MPDEIRFRDITALIYERLMPVLGLVEPWERLPRQRQHEIVASIKNALVNASLRGLLDVFPQDDGQSMIEQV